MPAADVHIIVKPGRPFATMFADSDDGKRWIAANIQSPCRSMAAFDPQLLEEFCLRIKNDGLVVKLSVAPGPNL